MTLYDYECLCAMHGPAWVWKRFPRSCRYLFRQMQIGGEDGKG